MQASFDTETPSGWPAVRAWRGQTRDRLLAARLATRGDERRRVRQAVTAHLQDLLQGRRRGCVALYWPIKAEIDLRPLALWLHRRGVETALPVVVAKRAPLEFWTWGPETELVRGDWNIPVPAQRCPCTPTVVVAPLLGFDDAGYRLGYGGGYYDRTLAAPGRRSLVIGVGQGRGRLSTIHPQPHDVPMHAVVTEAGTRWRRGAPCAPAASEREDHDVEIEAGSAASGR